MVEKYWKQFESSGKIEDYLNFVSHERDLNAGNVSQVEQGEHAGTYLRDGNGSEDLSRGGVRQAHYPSDERTW